MSGSTWNATTAALAVAAALAAAIAALGVGARPAAAAGGAQMTRVDACSLIGNKNIARLLGAGVQREREEIPLPPQPELNAPDLTTACSWANPGRFGADGLTIVGTNVTEANPAYKGPNTWSIVSERLIFMNVGRKEKGWKLVDNEKIAKREKAPWLGGDAFDVLVDRATLGKRKIQIGWDDGDAGYVVVSVTAARRDATAIALGAMRPLVG